MVALIIGYIVISGLIGIIFLVSSLTHKLFLRNINMTYILSIICLFLVLILKVFYKDDFLILGLRETINGFIIVLYMVTASIPAAILACLSHPKQRVHSLKAEILTGMVMEIPMRALVQNLFVVFGATAVVLGSVTNSILLTSIIWVQFIVVQEVMNKRSLNSKVILDSIASVWFSIWVGIIYITTGSIILAMITHGFERWISYMIRKSKILDEYIKNNSLTR